MTGVAASSPTRSLLLPVTSRWSEVAAALYGVAVVGIVAGSSGGFLPTTWGWTAVVTLWLAAIALLLRDRISIRALEVVYVGGMLTFTIWVALSNLWTPSVTSTMHEVQRDIAYTGVVAAGLVLVRSRAVPQLLGGVLVGIVLDSLYGLGTRVLPARFGGFDSTAFDYRLSAPITYWNGLGIFATIGFLLALGFAARSRHLVTRALAAATLPLLAATIYFTFSRGAWYALVLGLVAAIAIDPRRLQLLAISLVLAPSTVYAIVAGATRTWSRHSGRNASTGNSRRSQAPADPAGACWDLGPCRACGGCCWSASFIYRKAFERSSRSCSFSRWPSAPPASGTRRGRRWPSRSEAGMRSKARRSQARTAMLVLA